MSDTEPGTDWLRAGSLLSRALYASSGHELAADWLYAIGEISKEEWQCLRPPTPLDILQTRYDQREHTRREFQRIRADLAPTMEGLE